MFNIDALSKFNSMDDVYKAIREGNEGGYAPMVMAFAAAKKPIVCLVRGGCLGIAFTTLGHASMVYCTPDAFFKTPFMDSAQSAEGTSTLVFP